MVCSRLSCAIMLIFQLLKAHTLLEDYVKNSWLRIIFEWGKLPYRMFQLTFFPGTTAVHSWNLYLPGVAFFHRGFESLGLSIQCLSLYRCSLIVNSLHEPIGSSLVWILPARGIFLRELFWLLYLVTIARGVEGVHILLYWSPLAQESLLHCCTHSVYELSSRSIWQMTSWHYSFYWIYIPQRVSQDWQATARVFRSG